VWALFESGGWGMDALVDDEDLRRLGPAPKLLRAGILTRETLSNRNVLRPRRDTTAHVLNLIKVLRRYYAILSRHLSYRFVRKSRSLTPSRYPSSLLVPACRVPTLIGDSRSGARTTHAKLVSMMDTLKAAALIATSIGFLTIFAMWVSLWDNVWQVSVSLFVAQSTTLDSITLGLRLAFPHHGFCGGRRRVG
jgi:hypothetical protein